MSLENYQACMILHALGDTIGYRNGIWEFKKGGSEKAVEKLYEFIDLGGINDIDINGWMVSDDTILHLLVGMTLVENFNNYDEFCVNLAEKFIKVLGDFRKEGFNVRSPGLTTIKSIEYLKKGNKWDTLPYNQMNGGSGASMRNLCIGLAYHDPKDFNKLLTISIESSRITHNSTVGFLGGFVSALFTSYAVTGIDVKLWPFKLLKLLKGDIIIDYIKKIGRDVEEYMNDYNVFAKKWDKYINNKFDDSGNIIKERFSINVVARSQYYYDNYGFKNEDVDNTSISPFFNPGSGGDDSVIIAYDCLLDSGNSWEKLVIYSMLHAGDTDTTGCIAAAWYGTIYGYNGIPPNMLKYLEYKNDLENVAKKIYEKYKS